VGELDYVSRRGHGTDRAYTHLFVVGAMTVEVDGDFLEKYGM
jgi:hypothetical protein